MILFTLNARFLPRIWLEGIYVHYAILFAFVIGSALGSGVAAARNRYATPGAFQRVRYYILYATMVLGTLIFFRLQSATIFGFETNHITGHIGNTLIEGDFIVTDTWTNVIQPGDIVTFALNGRFYIAAVEDVSDDLLFVKHRDFWNKPIPRTALVGKVKYIWMSWNHGLVIDRFPRIL